MAQQSESPFSKKKNRLVNVRWILLITVLSFFMSVFFSSISTNALEHTTIPLAFLILLIFIFVGIFFDVVGVASTVATEKQFHSMAAKQVKGAKESVWIIKNAEKVSSFCNDVVGDISGIISGATGAIIISRLALSAAQFNFAVVSLVITGCIAAFTIGGKAMGKTFGINHSRYIVFAVGKLMYYACFWRIGKK